MFGLFPTIDSNANHKKIIYINQMKLTQNFTLEELIKSDTANKYNIDNSPNEKTISTLKSLCENILQPIRDKLGKAIIVTSGYRCEKLNKKVGGVSTSQHVKGEAADIECYDNKKLFDLISDMVKKGEIKVGQLIDEHKYSWVHVSLPNLKNNNQILHIK